MNFSATHRPLWALALIALLSLGVATPVGARENPRDREGRYEGTQEEVDERKQAHRAQRQHQDAPRPVDTQQESRARNNDTQRAAQQPAAARRDALQRQTGQADRNRGEAVRPQENTLSAQREQAARVARQREERGDMQRAERFGMEARQEAQRRAAAAQGAERRQAQQRSERQLAEARVEAQRRQTGQHRDGPVRRADQLRQSPQRISREQQEQRIHAERHRAERYRNQHAQQRHVTERRARELQQQRRMAQYRYEQQYLQRMRQQHASWNARRYNPYNDQYFYTPASHRYSYDGRYRETNRYGADLMRQAISYGYEEGLHAGRADRMDGWRADYRNSYGYVDASYGYNGYYLDQEVYNHYFRQGFQRGYQDGYSNDYRHGRRDNNGNYAILSTVLGVILGLQLLH